jgi:hypothetical protein
MGEAALYEAIRRGVPLVEINVTFLDGVDCVTAIDQLNSIAEDFHLLPQPWYGNPQLRVGSATKEALERLFGWKLRRVPLPKYDEVTKSWGHWPDVYCWEEVSPVIRFPFQGVIRSIVMSQPGTDDDGQWYE